MTMMPAIPVEKVFTPDDNPTFTYVERADERSEQTLQEVARAQRFVVSISGPSKSGKTVTVRRVFGEDLIEISGSNLSEPRALWNRVLDWMDVPSSTTHSTSTSTGAQGGAKVPFVAASVEHTSSDTIVETRHRSDLDQVINEIGNSSFVIFIDDFHYIDQEVQKVLTMQIKSAMEAGVKIIAASVPHRSEDLLRGNPELRGRLINIDISYWKNDDLREIARKGFDTMNISLPNVVIDKFAKEASGSPQLMRAMCQFFCYHFNVLHQLDTHIRIELGDDDIKSILDRTTIKCNFGDLVAKLHGGPKTRGTERKVFAFNDGSHGDVYRAVLLGVRSGEPKLGLKYDEIVDRIRQLCIDDAPVGSSIVEACKQIARISDAVIPGARTIELDEAYEILNLSDPYLLFYLRCSQKLDELGKQTEHR